jgi:hypothetical protein
MLKVMIVMGFFLSEFSFSSFAQENKVILKTALEPYKIKGRRSPLSKNLSFAGYKTCKVKRTIGSFISIGTIDPVNVILSVWSIPLRPNEKYKNKDVFRFKMKNENGSVINAKCRAVLAVKEKFRLLRSQDSSFFGLQNKDFLIATIYTDTDTSNRWSLAASNLNATKNEEQKGKLVCKNEEVSFTIKNLMLKEKNNPETPEQNFSSLNMVYAFTYKDEVVAAVSVKEAARKFWIKPNIDVKIRDAIAATAAILTIRRNLFRK